MSLKDYQSLVSQFWKEKSSKKLKEKSAFEPYRCSSYRPYLMNYHDDRSCRSYERNENAHKYKRHSPKCDQCDYHDLHPRKATSSLENIILKLKKSRNDDDKIPSHAMYGVDDDDDRLPHSTLKTSSHAVSPPAYPREKRGLQECPRMDYNAAERELLSEKCSQNKIKFTPEQYTELIENTEKSSFVTLLEQQDDISYASTLSMASNLESNPSYHKSDDKPAYSSADIDLEKTRNSSHVPANVMATNQNNRNDKSDTIDKITETKCDKCHKRFYRKSQLIRHISNHVVHECHKCNAFFYCVRKFKKHMSTHESYPCEFCEEEFYEASAWYHHRAKHTMVECSSCDMIFYNKTALLKHKFTHLQYICPVCRFPFSNLNHWISHRSCHKTFGSTLLTPLFSCRECSTTFPSQDTYMKHTCLHRQKKSGDSKRTIISKRDITDLIGVDQTAK